MPGSSRSTAPDEARIAILQHVRGRKKCMFNAIRRGIPAAPGRDPASPMRREQGPPTLGNNVVVGAGAAILGAITIGDGSRVGGGSVVVNDVPPNSVVVGIPGKVIYRDGNRIAPAIDLEHTDLPDPVSKAIEQLLDRIHGVEAEVEALKKKL